MSCYVILTKFYPILTRQFAKEKISLDIELICLERQPDWISAFRYYRLPQVTPDLFESYRNLYLGFESLLHEICPKDNNEHEKVWLERALENVSEKVDLSRVVPSRIRYPVIKTSGS